MNLEEPATSQFHPDPLTHDFAQQCATAISQGAASGTLLLVSYTGFSSWLRQSPPPPPEHYLHPAKHFLWFTSYPRLGFSGTFSAEELVQNITPGFRPPPASISSARGDSEWLQLRRSSKLASSSSRAWGMRTNSPASPHWASLRGPALPPEDCSYVGVLVNLPF